MQAPHTFDVKVTSRMNGCVLVLAFVLVFVLASFDALAFERAGSTSLRLGFWAGFGVGFGLGFLVMRFSFLDGATGGTFR
jgi:hypothetical protein